jgi:hypothetical protein
MRWREAAKAQKAHCVCWAGGRAVHPSSSPESQREREISTRSSFFAYCNSAPAKFLLLVIFNSKTEQQLPRSLNETPIRRKQFFFSAAAGINPFAQQCDCETATCTGEVIYVLAYGGSSAASQTHTRGVQLTAPSDPREFAHSAP